MSNSAMQLQGSYPIIWVIWIIVMFNFVTVLSSNELNTVSQIQQNVTRRKASTVFDSANGVNFTAQLGTTAYLPCKLKTTFNLGNRSQAWIRLNDNHIISVDQSVFIADDRFITSYAKPTNTWTLQIKYVQPRDSGRYECQIGFETKLSMYINLIVIVPKTQIIGVSELYVKSGSTVTLRCVVTPSLFPPTFIFWYKDKEMMIEYNQQEVEINVKNVSSDTTVGELILHDTNIDDSGNYSCSPTNLEGATIALNVLNGEEPAAMQRGRATWRVSRGDDLLHYLHLAGIIVIVVAHNLFM